MSITVSLNNRRHIAAASASWVAAKPADGVSPYKTAQEYVQSRLEVMIESWRDVLSPDRVLASDFILRFAASEYASLLAAANVNQQAAALLNRLRESTHVWLGSDEAQQAMAFLVQGGLLSQARANEILHYDIPVMP